MELYAFTMINLEQDLKYEQLGYIILKRIMKCTQKQRLPEEMKKY